MLDEFGAGCIIADHLNSEELLGTFAVSPGRNWIVYTCYAVRENSEERLPGLRVVSADGQTDTDLTSWDPRYQPCYFNPVFSLKGDYLVCEHTLQSTINPDLLLLELYEIGGCLHVIPQTRISNPMKLGNQSPRFLHDGKEVIYFGNYASDDLLEVCIYDPERAESEGWGVRGTRLTKGADGVWFRPKAIAVHSQWGQVFFIRGHSQPVEQIAVIDLADLPAGTVLAEFTVIGGNHSHIGSLQLSPNGSALLFDADDTVFLVDTTGRNCRKLSPPNTSWRNPVFSADGIHIAFTNGNEIKITDHEGAETNTFATGPWLIEELVWC